jgi:hypothetical protein
MVQPKVGADKIAEFNAANERLKQVQFRTGKNTTMLAFIRSMLREPEPCRKFSADEKMLCHVVSRFLVRRMHEDVGKGLNSSAVCQKMADRHLVSFIGEPESTGTAADALAK